MADEQESIDIGVGETLGAETSSSQCFSIYIPNKDRNGREIGDQRHWVLEALQMLADIHGGASAMPPIEGGWRNDDGVIIWENPVVVYSYIRPDAFQATLSRMREFLHRMGRETDQGEIAVELDERFYRIRKFDPA